MKAITTRLYAAAAVLALALDVIGLGLYALSWSEIAAVVERPFSLLETPETLVTSFALVGLLILRRRPGNAVGRLLIGIGFFSGLFVFATGYSIYSQLAADLAGGGVACWVGTWAWFPGFGLILSSLMLLFPDGQPPSERWRPIARLAMGAVVVGTLAAAMQPAGSANLPVAVPCFTPPVTVGGSVLGLTLGAVMAFGVVGLVALVRKAVGGGRVIRAQIKWFALATGVLVLAVSGREITASDSALHLTFVALSMIAVLGVPVALGVAILRHRLYDIDQLISRTVSYALLTASLGVIFVLSVFVLRTVIPWEGELPVAVSTLAVAAVFNPLRSRLQRGVDRRFNRSRYDTARVVDAFGLRLRSEAGIDDLADELIDVTQTTMQPSTAALWLKGQG